MKVAVAVLAKAPVPGRVKTRLVPPLSPVQAARVARVCLEETLRRLAPAAPGALSLHLEGDPDRELLALAASLGVPVRPQAAGDLGARIGAAMRALRRSGADSTIAIGSDCPTLSAARLDEAARALREHDVVIGPTEDGGYYLIGTRLETEELFEEIPWSTSRVAGITTERARATGRSVFALPRAYDVDDAASLRRAIEEPGGLTRLADLLPTLGRPAPAPRGAGAARGGFESTPPRG